MWLRHRKKEQCKLPGLTTCLKTKKQMTIRSKILLENLLQPAATNSKAWKSSCRPQENIVHKHNAPARCSNKLFANTTFLHAAREHCLQTLPCCNLHSTFAVTQKPVQPCDWGMSGEINKNHQYFYYLT